MNILIFNIFRFKWPKSEEKTNFGVGGFGYLNLTHPKLRGDGMAVAPLLSPGCGRQWGRLPLSRTGTKSEQ